MVDHIPQQLRSNKHREDNDSSQWNSSFWLLSSLYNIHKQKNNFYLIRGLWLAKWLKLSTSDHKHNTSKSSLTEATCGAGTAYPSKLIPGF